jgi:hypothetical protein
MFMRRPWLIAKVLSVVLARFGYEFGFCWYVFTFVIRLNWVVRLLGCQVQESPPIKSWFESKRESVIGFDEGVVGQVKSHGALLVLYELT